MRLTRVFGWLTAEAGFGLLTGEAGCRKTRSLAPAIATLDRRALILADERDRESVDEPSSSTPPPQRERPLRRQLRAQRETDVPGNRSIG